MKRMIQIKADEVRSEIKLEVDRKIEVLSQDRSVRNELERMVKDGDQLVLLEV